MAPGLPKPRRSALPLMLCACLSAGWMVLGIAQAKEGDGGGGNSGSGGGSSSSGSNGNSGSGGGSGSGSSGGNSGSGGSGNNGARGNNGNQGGGKSEQDRAREAVSKGWALGLGAVMPTVRNAAPGDILDVRLSQINGAGWVYTFKVLSADGQYRLVSVDARTNQILTIRSR